MPTTVFNDNSLCFYGMSGDGRYATVSGAQLSPGSSHSNNSWDSRSSSNSTRSSAMSPDTTTCEDGSNRPFLKITEQPTPKFRFRYRSEMQGTHGAIQGEKAAKQKKTFPTVKLCNYDGIAYIRCTLYSAEEDNRHIHAHRLVAKGPDKKEDKDDPHDLKVGPVNNYEACFQTMVIIHTPKKMIIDELIKKKKLQITSKRPLDGHKIHLPDEVLKKITRDSNREADYMDMNKVSLRFDAFKEDPLTGELVEICKPIYSKPIQNMKSHLTSDLKICRIDKHIGSCRGGEEVFIFVEKVSKKNIKVRFFELNEDDEECWCDYARFTETDVHHQYAIAFRTPPYKDVKIDKYVTVYVQLERPSDKCVSEKVDFQYKPEYQICSGSKRKAAEDIRLLSPSPQLSLQLPDTTDFDYNPNLDSLNSLLRFPGILCGENDITMSESYPTIESNPSLTKELEKLSSANSQEFKKFIDSISPEYLDEYEKSVSDDESELARLDYAFPEMDISADDNIDTDGIVARLKKGRKKLIELHDARITKNDRFSTQCSDDIVIDGASSKEKPPVNRVKMMSTVPGSDVLTKENLPQRVIHIVKKMSRLDMRMGKKQILRQLEILFSNEADHIDRDSVLHMAVMYGKETELEILLDMCKTYNLLSCIDAKNKEEKTPLHIAAKLKLEKAVDLLLSCKADPSVQDTIGNTPLHYATMEQSVNIIKKLVHKMETTDIEARNEVGQTALHIAVGQNSYEIVETLLKAGAGVNRSNACTGDTPLHIAVINRDLKMVNILLKEENININIENLSQCTPLTYLLDNEDMEAKEDICNALLEFKERKTDQDCGGIVYDLVKSSSNVKSEDPDMVDVDGELVDISKKVKEEFFSGEELNIMDVDIKHSPPRCNSSTVDQSAASAVYVSDDQIKEEKSELDENEKCSKDNEDLSEINPIRSPLYDEQNYDDLGDLRMFDNAALAELCPLLDRNGGWKLLAISLGFREFLTNFSKHWSPTYLLLLYVDKYYNKTLKHIKDHLVELDQKEAASSLERLIKRTGRC